jgi:hypothetical protein
MNTIINYPLFWIAILGGCTGLFLLIRWIYRDSKKIDNSPFIRGIIAVVCGLKLRNLIIYLFLRKKVVKKNEDCHTKIQQDESSYPQCEEKEKQQS